MKPKNRRKNGAYVNRKRINDNIDDGRKIMRIIMMNNENAKGKNKRSW